MEFDSSTNIPPVSGAESGDKSEKTDKLYADFYDEMPREIVEYLINTHPLNGKESKTASERRASRTTSKSKRATEATYPNYSTDGDTGRKRDIEDEVTIWPKTYEGSDDYSETTKDERSGKKMSEKRPVERTRSAYERREAKSGFLVELMQQEDGPKIFIIGAVFVLILLIGIIVFVVTHFNKDEPASGSGNAATAKTQVKVPTLAELAELNASLETEVGSLSRRVDDLTDELVEIKSSMTNGNDSSQGNLDTSGEGAGSALNSGIEGDIQNSGGSVGTITSETTYTVVKGDSLWKLGIKFYGKGELGSLIKEANNLPSDSIAVGVTLKIPPKP